ncbi:MAG TPA: Hsp20/alpha crystallin family protein [bacterium]|nr:Hsp20/alpha crystallin family protein [bacterium]
MAITRWNPAEPMTLRSAIDRLFDEAFFRPTAGWPQPMAEGGAFPLPLEILEQGNALVVKAQVPGIRPEDLNIQVKDDLLTITGETRQDEERKDQNYFVREHRYGRFERSALLPYPVQQDAIDAVLENGILTLTLPKAPQTMGQRIPVRLAGQQAPASLPGEQATNGQTRGKGNNAQENRQTVGAGTR